MWKAAVDLICRHLCCSLHEEYPNDWANAVTALTHPEIFRRSNLTPRDTFSTAIGVISLVLGSVQYKRGPEMEEFQNYLSDRERAGWCFVDGGMYATLCLLLFKVVLASDTL